MNNKRFIGQKIRDLRKSMKLTQSQFSELIDLSENALGKLERGINTPNVETLYKIADKSKIPIEILVSSKNKNPSQELDKPLSDFNTYLKTCSPEEIKLVHRIAAKIFRREKVKKKKKSEKSTQKAILVITGDLLKIFLIK